ncbi:DinB family protein [Empedobacter falsenii]|uniref:DinB family protein n=1 Tax=Empedobacter TaxID=59734 RepID=UPI002448413C|nr:MULTISPECIES: DinB family protein [Empedobacter]MDH1881625.1 DinB family protein [Empedobacter sp. GD03797]MDM1041520.1 DinB family protein [Empedobacter brevis]MDM1135099.1 DinB family protein [Empedobacter sp. R750]
MDELLIEFEKIINDFPKQVEEINEHEFNFKPSIQKWSKKEILGHLIDSGVINYLRFIIAQFQNNPQIYYEQNDYCNVADYQNSEKKQLLNLWESINEQLLFLFLKIIRENKLDKICNDISLNLLMEDYINHLKHHQKQIISR